MHVGDLRLVIFLRFLTRFGLGFFCLTGLASLLLGGFVGRGDLIGFGGGAAIAIRKT